VEPSSLAGSVYLMVAQCVRACLWGLAAIPHPSLPPAARHDRAPEPHLSSRSLVAPYLPSCVTHGDAWMLHPRPASPPVRWRWWTAGVAVTNIPSQVNRCAKGRTTGAGSRYLARWGSAVGKSGGRTRGSSHDIQNWLIQVSQERGVTTGPPDETPYTDAHGQRSSRLQFECACDG